MARCGPYAALFRSAVRAATAIGGVVDREVDWRRMREPAVEGAVQTAVWMLLVATSALLSDYLTSLQAPQQIAEASTHLTTEPGLVLALLNIFLDRKSTRLNSSH